MARRVAPLKNTSGTGFVFEDKVAAYFLVCLISGETPFNVGFGSFVRLDFQVRVNGWYLDDMLFTSQRQERIALSIKSDAQITSRSVPDNFVGDAWGQYLHEGSQVFDAQRDLLALASATPAPDVKSGLDEMLRWARDQDEVRFLAQVQAPHASSDIKRNLFASLQCPQELAVRHGVMAEDAVRFLRRLRFYSFDFLENASQWEAASRRMCQNALSSGDPTQAQDLWQRLIEIASRFRQSGGYLDLPRLLTELDDRFELKQWLQYALDAEAIRRWTRQALEKIPNTVGLRVRLPRSADIAKIDQHATDSGFVALTGPSGCGKSVMVRNWIETLPVTVPVLWLAGKDLVRYSPMDLQGVLHLRHPLEEVAKSLTSSRAYCVVDNAGGIATEEGYANLASLATTLRVGEDGSPWHLLVVCQQEEWNRVLSETCRAQGRQTNWARLNVQGPTEEELSDVWQAFPQLLPLARQRELRTLLLRPKVLDLIARHVALGADVDTKQWVGESSVAMWHWHTEVAKHPATVARAQAMMRVAEQQADALAPEVNISLLPPETDALINDNLLSSDDGRTVSFQHDLYGDWARLQVLIGKGGELADFINSKLVSPFWNRAVRLYGVYLLEQHQGAEQWKSALNQLAADSDGGNLGQDLILEAVFYAANPLPLLEAIWPYLREDKGDLLRRLLGRFLYTATEPNAQRLALAKTPMEEMRQSTVDRFPYWPYWLPMLTFLHAHKNEVIDLALMQAADVVHTWLRFTSPDYPRRQEAADMAVALGETVLAHERDYGYSRDGMGKLALTAALAAIRERPKEVRDLALRASGRKPRPDWRIRNDADIPPVEARALSFPYSTRRRRVQVVPWPDGPVQRPLEAFENICFEDTALFPVINAAPELAGETLLALLINLPREYDMDDAGVSSVPGSECEIGSLRSHYPPFYLNLPWLYFLRVQPKEAIETIVKLINFATERRVEFLSSNGRASMKVTPRLDGPQQEWIGDGETYFWYTGLYGPHATSSALMALEFWLYERMEAKEPVEEYLAQIAASSRSVAFAGVLAALSCRYQELLAGPLRFLISVAQFLYVDREKLVYIRPETALIAWGTRGKESIRLAREWHGMPHRKQSLDAAAQILFLTDPEVRTYMEEVRREWEHEAEEIKRSGSATDAADLDRLISAFTSAHYSYEYDEERKGIFVTHNYPKELDEHSRREREKAEFGLLRTTFPIKCRCILDGEASLDTDTDKELLWQNCQEIAGAADSGQSGSGSKEDALCGAAAVLLLKCGDWLTRYADRAAWCREQILSTIEQPPQSSRFDSDVAVAEWNWHSFCAEALPMLWSEDLKSRRLRTCVLHMALDRHHHTVRLLFRSCHTVRERLGDEFLKVQALVRYWSLERPNLWRREDAQNDNFILRMEERQSFRKIMRLSGRIRNKLLSKPFRETVDAFISGTLSPVLPLLYEAYPQPDMSFNSRRNDERRRIRYGSDIELLRWTYSHLPDLNLAKDSKERAALIALGAEFLDCLLRTLSPLTEEDRGKEIEGMPYEVDNWILAIVAALVMQLQTEEEPRQFWEPVLELGWQAHYWVEHFLTHFVFEGLQKAEDAEYKPQFIQLWSAMIDYADTAENWNRSQGRRAWHLDDIWEHLMGLDWFYVSPWSERQRPVMQDMKAHFRLFCSRHMTGSRTLSKFLRLLREPAALPLRLEALAWIEPHLGGGGRDEEDVEYQLSNLLAECWQNHQAVLRLSAVEFDCFKRLVKWLADRQNALALETQNRIISG